MKREAFTPTERSRVKRLPSRGSYDREQICAILDQGILCHVGLVTEHGPVVIPMSYARRGDELILHGSAKSRLLNELAKGVDVCVTVTHLDGLVLARSTFHHSINYRSAVVFGRSELIEDPQEKAAALDALVEQLVPERGRDARGANEGELAATFVVRVPIAEASAKVRTGPPVDEERDREIDIWAGVLPLERHPGEPIADEFTKPDCAVPDYVLNYPEGR